MKFHLPHPFPRLPRCLLGLGLVSVLAVLPVSAADFTWDGSLSSNDWNAVTAFPNDINWTPNSLLILPGALDTVTFPDTASDHTVYLNGDRAVSSATFTGGSAYLISDDLTQYALTLGSGDITASGATTHRFGANADLVLGADGTWDVAANTTLEINSNISGGFSLTKTGSGTLNLGANNSHDGTLVEGGILEIDHANRIGANGTPLMLVSQSQLRATGNLTISSNRSLILSGGGEVNTNANSISWTGTVVGSGGLAKTGSGTLTLAGANTYGGGTTVSAGTLKVTNTSGFATATGPVLVQSGATISGSGSVAGILTIASGATVSPGGSGINSLTAVTTVTLDGAYKFDAKGNQSDLLAVEGVLNFSGTLDITASKLTADYYVVATYGILSGSPTVNNLPADFDFYTSVPSWLATLYDLDPKSIVLARGIDYADAPEPYPTSHDEDGAFHIAKGPQLGLTRNDTAAPTHSDNADAHTDDDGVLFDDLYIGQLMATATITVSGADPSGAKLDAWIDFNNDGSWGKAGEQIANSVTVYNGSNTLTFDVPAWASGLVNPTPEISELDLHITHELISRFRISSGGNLGWGGGASDGEVEDHQVSVRQAGVYQYRRLPGGADERTHLGEAQELQTSSEVVSAIATGDMNGDGYMDVVAVEPNTQGFGLWLNDGRENFTRAPISTSISHSDVALGDLDGDGDLDIVAAQYLGKMRWYENRDAGDWPERIVYGGTASELSANRVTLADFDADGDLDIAQNSDSGLSLHENDGTGTFEHHETTTGGAYNFGLDAADVDRDGDMDLISSSGSTVSGNPVILFWAENLGSNSWQYHTVRSLETDDIAPLYLKARDSNRDGYVDVFFGHPDRSTVHFATHFNNEGDLGEIGNETELETFASRSSDNGYDWGMDIAMIVGTGSPETVMQVGGKLLWKVYRSGVKLIEVIDADAGSPSIGIRQERGNAVSIADVDGDLDLDIVAIKNEKVVWYPNLSPTAVEVVDAGDAPSPYPVTEEEDGAQHLRAGPGPHLGSAVEKNVGEHSEFASGDQDDDGVQFTSNMFVGYQDRAVLVDIREATGRVDAWVDFDGDGAWDSAGEQIVDSLELEPGIHGIAFDIPAWAVLGTTFARIRISTDGDLDPTGVASDGEVEDYLVVIAPAPLIPDPAGPYVISEGDSLTLTGSSTGGTGTTSYSWDLNGDDDFGDAIGTSPVLTWADLELLGLDNDGVFDITMRATDDLGFSDATTGLTISNSPPSVDAGGSYQMVAGESLQLAGSASDFSSLDAAALTYSWDLDGDGIFDTFGAAPLVASSSLEALGLNKKGVYPIKLRVSDDDSYVDAASELTVILSAHGTWAVARGLTPGIDDGLDADPNGDGLPNIAHFAFDTDPLGDGSDEGKVRLTLEDVGGVDYLTLTLPVRNGAVFSGDPLVSGPVDGLIYSILGDTDLADPWDLEVVEMAPSLDTGLPALGDYDATLGADWEYRSFRLIDPVSAHGRAFMKTGVTSAP